MAVEEFHPDDVDSINRMVGDIWRDQETVEALKAEYLPRLRMFHREGATGAMGITALVDCLRYVGMGPPDHAELRAALEKEIDWTRVDTQSSVEVRLPGGVVHYGQFMGLGNDGMLYVKIEDDPVLQELPKRDVKLAEEVTDLDRQSFRNPLRDDDREKLARRRELEEFLDEEEPEPPRRRQPKKKRGRPKKAKKKAPRKAAKASQSKASQKTPASNGKKEEAPRFDWLSVQPGIDVMVRQTDGEYEPANFIDVGERDGELIVIMHGEEDRQVVPENYVSLLSEA